ncbi:MAG TPA: phosphoribosyltransferase family protein [Candidatus Paceibacterota bacterium]|jgi:putative phosphoribosyl transferase|nr:phosphoribosyltransferase family protein [Candidatus Paceibacterota bacterium]
MVFASREAAGRKLGDTLRRRQLGLDVVLGLPRGGVIVAAEVAAALKLPLGVLVVRKIGHPWCREFAVGALAEGGVVVLDQDSIEPTPGIEAGLNAILREEEQHLAAYQARFGFACLENLAFKSVLLVDDGVATGATMEAAVQSARRRKARTVTVAAPVASTSAVERLRRVADELEVLCVDPDFAAVGRYYESFPQISDEEVLKCLRRLKERGG